jgi:hypothetical protein
MFLKIGDAEGDGKGRIVEEHNFNGFIVEISVGNSIL